MDISVDKGMSRSKSQPIMTSHKPKPRWMRPTIVRHEPPYSKLALPENFVPRTR